ncbi:MAG: putative spermidine/putrescine transport system substrate-binding protein [Trebonia sp.]|nr:putative spermidine/putrescine transport system substrate-binding protein [Trebonia sp.]
MRASKAIAATVAAVGSIMLAAGCSSSSSSSSAPAAAGSSTSAGGSSSASTTTDWSTPTSAAAGGGMTALIAAAKKEGHLNVITLPADWANYGTIMKDFTAKYGIQVTDENPDGTSQDELNAIQQTKGQSRAPDVVDVGTAFAAKGQTAGDWAPYQVATWSSIPASSKEPTGQYYADYGGYVAIGYDSSRVKTPPTSFKSLLTGPYKNMVALNGSPTQAGAAFAGVYAAALSNGGSFANIAPGVAYFKRLKQAGNFVPVTGSASTMESGQTPILVWWDYLLASEVGAKYKNLKIVIPTDSHYAAYYDQAVSKYAPDPAAARLWEEYLYSTEGQNLFLDGGTRPIELPSLVSAGTVDKAAYAALPPAPPGGITFPSIAQQNSAETVVAQQWPGVSS